MTNYTLQCEETQWVRTGYTSEEEGRPLEEQNRDIVEIVENGQGYYWIATPERDDVLVVNSFTNGEEILRLLEHGQYDSFEEAVEESEYAEIRSRRPPL